MSERDRAMALAAAIEAFGVRDFTPVRVNAYLDALKDIPVPLLNAAVRRSIQTRSWFPKVAELRADAESCRRELLEAHPYERCAACNHMGTVRIGIDAAGRPKYARCKCWAAYQARMSELGVSEKPVARLTAGEPEAPMEPPALDDLAPQITDQIAALARSKGL